jgi:hypothetical protein
MSIPTIRAGGRYFGVTPSIVSTPGFPFVEIGPGGTGAQVGAVLIQFAPSLDFVGQFIVMARPLGTAADVVDTPFVPVYYRLASLNDVAQPYTLVSDPIGAASAQIVVPSPGTSVVLLTTCSAGQCNLTSWLLEGNFTP